MLHWRPEEEGSCPNGNYILRDRVTGNKKQTHNKMTSHKGL